MNDARFFDGIREEANRTNEASGRSWHIPEERSVNLVWPIIWVLVVAVVVSGAVAG